MGRFGWMVVVAALARAQSPEEPPTFQVGTHLVEVDVVVHDKNGPVTGLTKDDFTVFDCEPRPVSQDQINTFGVNTSWCRAGPKRSSFFTHRVQAGQA